MKYTINKKCLTARCIICTFSSQSNHMLHLFQHLYPRFMRKDLGLGKHHPGDKELGSLCILIPRHAFFLYEELILTVRVQLDWELNSRSSHIKPIRMLIGSILSLIKNCRDSYILTFGWGISTLI